MTVIEVCRGLARHPIRRLLRRWNWKNALFTALVRGGVFFAANLVAGWPAAIRALVVDAAFRVPLSGVYAAITQELAFAEPRCAALLVIVGVVPAASHVIEFATHWLMATPELRTSVMASVVFSTASGLFNLFTIERGAFLVGASARPFGEDLRRVPVLLVEFMVFPVRAAARRAMRPRNPRAC